MTERINEYSEALFKLAAERGELDKVGEEINGIFSAFSAEPRYYDLISAPSIPVSERTMLFNRAFQNVSDTLKSFFAIIIERGYIRQLEDITGEFTRMLDLAKKSVKVTVKTALEMTKDEKKRLTKALEKKYNKTVLCAYEIDNSIIGGVVIQTDEGAWDASIRRRLDAIKEVIEK